MSFGRKGVLPGQIASVAARPAVRACSGDDAMAARREAFLAAERARNAGLADSPAAESATTSDPLAGLRNGVRPATRRDDAVGQSWTPMPEMEARAAMQTRYSGGVGKAASRRRFIFGEPHRRSLALAYLFWFIAGQGSLHRFYCGQKDTALMQIGLLIGSIVVALVFPPLGVLGLVAWAIWVFADLFLMPGMIRRFKAEYATDYSGIFA